MHPYVAYYIRNALPFVTGIAFILGAEHFALPLFARILVGAALVIVGPFAIQLILTLVVEALRGPEAGALGSAHRPAFEFPDRLRR